MTAKFSQNVLMMPRMWMLLCLGCVVGCSDGDPFRYVKVSGSVSYEDGSKIPMTVRIIFAPQTEVIDGKFHARPGIAYTDANGAFTDVTSHKPDDGLVRGRHKVLVIHEGPDALKYIPREYTKESTTPLEVDTADAPFDLRIRKP